MYISVIYDDLREIEKVIQCQKLLDNKFLIYGLHIFYNLL